ncbi:uncharacterized protein [Rutidosis leptorrhynchoides]|uniref:uncharacterized protein n=1 Tax=Rutidosis leptorrhynchoides TaxID=125765 RepID=UPI003A9A0EB0
MAPFEMLYGRKCRVPVCWNEAGEKLIKGPELVRVTNEKVAIATNQLKEAQSRQKVQPGSNPNQPVVLIDLQLSYLFTIDIIFFFFNMTTNKYDKLYIVNSIHHLIPIKPDLTKINYNNWSSLFINHCAAFNVDNFLELSSTSDPPSDETNKVDVVILGWIYLTISESLLERLLNTYSKTSYASWEFLKKVFLDNKHSKTVELTAALRSLTIGDNSAEKYFHKIDSIAAMLANLDAKMKEEEIITYAINGLNDRFAHATHIILYSTPFPDLETVRSMITLEEMQLNRQKRISNESQGTPSAPSVLIA